MMSVTHATIAAAGTSLVLGTAEPLPLCLAVIGSQLPDLDTTTSTIGKIFFPISSWIEDRYPHRSITHCLLATAAIALVSLAVSHFLLGDIMTAIALPFGHLLACFSDTFTKQGVQLFYPEPAWAISVSNPRRRLKTGGAGELWVLAIATALLVLGIYLGNSGGLTTKVSQNLGLRDGVIAVYNENAATNHVYAQVRGVWSSDRTRADGKYWIVGTEGSEFVVTNGEGIYKTGEQIITKKVSTSVGDDATTEIKNLSFADENAIAPLLELRQAYPNSVIFLSGQLGIDFPEEVNISIKPKQYVTASLTGSTLNFRWQNLDEAILLLREQYAVGTLEAKIVQPQPRFN
ncbi:metal-dependent hydrolase [Myxosarcina sp. GI1]|uniref:metal-dependent hydrolase n=1 Tax=Myxosarcina sp. GI1 TaxID=1541065 RepID=UPI00055B7AE2|nr:metal-dependent hydrolase [Myxosarcina sp. GI1]